MRREFFEIVLQAIFLYSFIMSFGASISEDAPTYALMGYSAIYAVSAGLLYVGSILKEAKS